MTSLMIPGVVSQKVSFLPRCGHICGSEETLLYFFFYLLRCFLVCKLSYEIYGELKVDKLLCVFSYQSIEFGSNTRRRILQQQQVLVVSFGIWWSATLPLLDVFLCVSCCGCLSQRTH